MRSVLKIGLTGFAQSGKDTVGQYLVEKYGFTRVAFADAVRDCLYALNPRVATRTLGIPRVKELVDAVGWEEAKKESDVRELLQRMGTEVGRQLIDDQVWLTIALRKTRGLNCIVFTDVRFPNEAEFVRELGGIVVKVDRAGVTSINGHSSDAGLAPQYLDHILLNDGSLDDLYETVDRMMPKEIYASV